MLYVQVYTCFSYYCFITCFMINWLVYLLHNFCLTVQPLKYMNQGFNLPIHVLTVFEVLKCVPLWSNLLYSTIPYTTFYWHLPFTNITIKNLYQAYILVTIWSNYVFVNSCEISWVLTVKLHFYNFFYLI